MVLGTDNSPFVIALPRNESARIMKLEQDSDMLKLERDNLMDKLKILKRNTNEILESTNELENENNQLFEMVEKVEDEMNLAIPIKPIIPSQSVNIAPLLSKNKMNLNMSKPIENANINNSIPPKIQNNQPKIQKINEMPINKNPPQPKKVSFKKLKNGIISNIIKNEGEL